VSSIKYLSPSLPAGDCRQGKCLKLRVFQHRQYKREVAGIAGITQILQEPDGFTGRLHYKPVQYRQAFGGAGM